MLIAHKDHKKNHTRIFCDSYVTCYGIKGGQSGLGDIWAYYIGTVKDKVANFTIMYVVYFVYAADINSLRGTPLTDENTGRRETTTAILYIKCTTRQIHSRMIDNIILYPRKLAVPDLSSLDTLWLRYNHDCVFQI